MAKAISEVIGNEMADELRQEAWEMLGDENMTYSDMEDMLMGYGLEMDYFDQLFC